ncbi:MAG: hypothetical protein WAS21_10505 [Geminicoccaceae bacterium]
MANLVLGYDDRVRPGTITGTSALATLPVVNLQTQRLGQLWRGGPGVTTASLLVDFGASRTIGAVLLAGTNLSTVATWRIRLSTVDATGNAGDVLDTGTGPAGVDTRFRLALLVLPTDATGRYLKVDLSDASLPWLEAGRLAALKLWRPRRNFAFGMSRGRIDLGKTSKGEAGDLFALRGSQQRVFTMTLQAVYRDELLADAEDLLRTAGKHDDILLCLDPNSTNPGFDSIWGTMAELPAWEWVAHPIHKGALRVEERV